MLTLTQTGGKYYFASRSKIATLDFLPVITILKVVGCEDGVQENISYPPWGPGSEAHSHWAILGIFFEKAAILTSFGRHFERFLSNWKIC